MAHVYKKHIVSEMDETMIQRCIMCGEVISDYSHTAWPAGQSPPKGWAAGVVYVMPGCPTIMTTEIPENADFDNCKP
jgi:hypothetical protein